MRPSPKKWMEDELYEAFKITHGDLSRLVMRKLISEALDEVETDYTGQYILTQEQVDRVCQYLDLQDADEHVHELRARWEQNPNDKDVQIRLLQFLSFRRLFLENNRQGLRELWEYDCLASDTVHYLLDEIRRRSPQDDLFLEIVALLYHKVLPPHYKNRTR